jgi:DNA-3-methyladenine glycosylase
MMRSFIRLPSIPLAVDARYLLSSSGRFDWRPILNKSSLTKLKLRRLAHTELPATTISLARYLLGKVVVRQTPDGTLSGRIVETEAYLQGDAACHAFRGMTPRNRSLFLRRGHAYVYIAYGTSMMLNVASARDGIGEGVLIRALEPIEGVVAMQQARGVTRVLDLARGPGRLAQAMSVDLSLDGVDLCAPGPLWLGTDGRRRAPIGESTRIGLTKDAHRVLRFYIRGNPFVSGPKNLNP